MERCILCNKDLTSIKYRFSCCENVLACKDCQKIINECPSCHKGQSKDQFEEFERVMTMARAGYGWALEKISYFYDLGIGCKQNDEKAVEFLKKAADKNMVLSIYNLGHVFYRGECVNRDLNKALELWKQAADMGHEPSLNQLGTLYHKGGDDVFKIPEKEVSIDLEKARMYYFKGAEKGNKNCQIRLATMFGNGEGDVKQSYVTGIFYLRMYMKDNENQFSREFLNAKKSLDAFLKYQSSYCSSCGDKDLQEGKVKVMKKRSECARCQSVWYCNADCQKKHWKEGGHKNECKKA